MPSDPAFVAAVCDAPEDDAPRLVYADWLDDHGEADRAELIRVQVERARLPKEGPRAQALKAREDALLKARRDDWLRELPAWARLAAGFVRGFVGAVVARSREFLKGAAVLFRRAPVRQVCLLGLTDAQAAALAASPFLEHLTGLEVGANSLTGAGWRALVVAPGLANVAALELTAHSFSPAEAHALAYAPHLPNLTRLLLYGARLGPRGAHLGDRGLEELAGSPHLARLTTLHLVECLLGDGAARALAAAPHLTRLADLRLYDNHIGPGRAGVAARPRPGQEHPRRRGGRVPGPFAAADRPDLPESVTLWDPAGRRPRPGRLAQPGRRHRT